MKNIVIFGPPGAGKGTMSNKIVDDLGLIHMSTGDMIRSNQSRGTKIGKIADKLKVNEGNFLPDNVVSEMVKQEIIDNASCNGFIFDGFPRTTAQAKMLDEFMHARKTPIDIVIYLDIDKHSACNRVVERGRVSGRKDDTKEAFPNRWNKFNSETAPIIDYFNKRGKVHSVDATKSVDEVYKNIKKTL